MQRLNLTNLTELEATRQAPFETDTPTAPGMEESASCQVARKADPAAPAEPSNSQESPKLSSTKGGGLSKNSKMAAIVGGLGIAFFGFIFFIHVISQRKAASRASRPGASSGQPTQSTYGYKPTAGQSVLAYNGNSAPPPSSTDASSNGSVSVNDIIATGKPVDKNQPQSFQVGSGDSGTTSPNSKPDSGSSLASVEPFPSEGGHWRAPAYSSVLPHVSQSAYVYVRGDKKYGGEGDKSGSVVISNTKPSNFGFPVGFKVAVRLVDIASTAIRNPVIAVVEHPVMRGGELVMPAGAKFVGNITQANRQGIVGVNFTHMLFPDGSTIPVAAIALDKNLSTLKGDVTGKNTGRRFAVGLISNMGSVGSVLVGNNVNNPYSVSDQARQNLGQSIQTTGNQTIQELQQNEQIVVSVPAGTEFYVEFVDAK